MLNKNDPLIGAIQEVMKKNQAERDAVKAVNEKFGIQDRKVLPRERQAEWDAAYNAVLTEGLHPNQQKLDVHEPEKDKLTAQDFKMLRAKKKPMEEDVTSPSSMGIKKPDYAAGTPDYANKGPQMVNRAAKTSLPAGTMKEENIEEKLSKSMSAGKVISDFVHSKDPKFEGKSKKERMKMALGAYYGMHPEKSKKMDEGFNNRHNSSVNASVEEQVVADQLNEDDIDSYENRMTAGIGGFTPYGGGRFGGGGAKISRGSTTAGKVKASNINTRTGERLTSVPSVSQVKGRRNRIAVNKRQGNGPWGSAKPPEVKTTQSKLSSPSGTFAANLQKSRQAAQNARAGGSTVAATQAANRTKMSQTAQNARTGGSTVSATQQAARTANQQKLAQTTQSGRAGGSTVAATQAANRAKMAQTAKNNRVGGAVSNAINKVKQKPKLAAGVAAGAALAGFAATQLTNKPAETSAATSSATPSAPSSTAAKKTQPAVSKPAAPKAASTPAPAPKIDREARRRVLAGKEGVGPEAAKMRERSGVKLGVTSGTTVRQSPGKLNSRLPGK